MKRLFTLDAHGKHNVLLCFGVTEIAFTEDLLMVDVTSNKGKRGRVDLNFRVQGRAGDVAP